MKRAFWLLIVMLAVSPVQSWGYLIDRVEAVVNGKVITKSEVDRSVRIEAMRRGVSGSQGIAGIRSEVLDALINRILLLEEARKFNLVQVGAEEVDAAVDSIIKRYASREEFKRYLQREDMTEDELRAEIGEQILALKYVDRRVRYFIRVTLDDQKRYYEENLNKYEGRTFNDAQEEIYNVLVEKETGKKLEDYLNSLRGKANITVFSQPGE